jgi:hypothetical protein
MSRYVNPVPQYYLNDGSVASSGKLYFYENKDPNTKKDTFNDPDEQIKNTNPIILDGEGRCPPIFATGRYTVVFKSNNNIQQWSRDDVDLTTVLGQFADWSAIITYRINDIARGSDGNYYSSLINNNLGNDPVTSPTLWEEIVFLTFWNANATYSQDEIAVFEGNLYRSLTNDNIGNQPDISISDWLNITELGQLTQNVLLGGDFSGSAEVRCNRIGNLVTITSSNAGGVLGHTSSSAPTSVAGAIPVEFRPTGSQRSVVYGTSSARVSLITIDQTGLLRLNYRDWAGLGAASTTSDVAVSITYDATP